MTSPPDDAKLIADMRKNIGHYPFMQEAADRLSSLIEEVADYQASFDLRWKASRRAVTKWQAAGEGREMTWPDHADLCVWLIEENERLRDEVRVRRIADHDVLEDEVMRLRAAMEAIAERVVPPYWEEFHPIARIVSAALSPPE